MTNSERGVWAITEEGDRFLNDAQLDEDGRVEVLRRLRAEKIREAAVLRAARAGADADAGSRFENAGGPEDADELEEALDPVAGRSWKERLITLLTSDAFAPAKFERLTQRLLREADFESVSVTGRSGDQGIDGVGIYRLGLLTFPVFFQCKRYSGSVGAGEVRDFRGAMQGRGEKGLLITTGAFTAAAKSEASRDGATPIDLIDGDRLCELLRRYELGVSVRIVEEVTVTAEFFEEI